MSEFPAFTSMICILAFMILMMSVFLALSIRVVPEEKRLQVYRLGRDVGLKGPGLVLLIPVIDRGVMREAGGELQTAQRLAGNPAETGEAQTEIFREGEATFAGETWPAVSSRPIRAGRRVRIKRVLLEVEDVLEDDS